jgi:hypothetical protein
MDIISCSFTHCYAGNRGGAVSGGSNININNTLFQSCRSLIGGGAYGANLKMYMVDFIGCTATEKGGGIYINNYTIDLTLCRFENCVAPNGSAIYIADSRSSDRWVIDCIFVSLFILY